MSEVLKGGIADGKTIEDIARKHSVFVGTIKLALEKGIKVELEHTSDYKTAREIAMDHLWEDPEYYEKLEKMEKEKGSKKETKECTGADASGSFEAPIFGKTIMKKDIHKLHNYGTKKPLNEMDGIPGMQYDAPIGHKSKDPLTIDNPGDNNGTFVGNKKMDKKAISSKPKNFPMWVKGGKYVSIDPATTKYPYRNQGAGSDGAWKNGNSIKVYEIRGMKEAIQEASKKYGITVEDITKIVSEALPVGMLDNPGNKKAMKSWIDKGEKKTYHITTELPIDIKTDDETDLARLKMIFYKYDISFHDHVIKK
jgi:hypothetical protein